MNLRTSKSSPQPLEAPIDFWKLFQNLPEPYLLLEAKAPDYTIVELNKAREKLAGVSRAKAIGKPVFSVYPPQKHLHSGQASNQAEATIKKVLRTGKPQTLNTARYDLKGPDGNLEARYWQSTYIAYTLGGKEITHILTCAKEVTKEYAAADEIRRAEERLEAALAVGKVGSWVWDLETNLLMSDAMMAKMFGVKPSDAAKGLPVSEFTGVVHKDDVKRVFAAIDYAVEHRTLFEEEYRTVDRRGKLHWVIARARLVEQDGRQTFPGVLVDITERRDLQAQIELAHQQDRLNQQAAKILHERNEELEALSRTKDEFVALASHQLRTPATAVKQYLGMVLQGYMGEVTDVQMEMLGKAFESNERQIQIINQILNAARADTGRLIMLPVPLDVRNLVEGIVTDMRPAIEQLGHAFKVLLPKQPLQVVADSGYLRMAIENILHNASVYTPSGGSITLKLTKAGKSCRLSIADTGVGIKKADLSKLFSKFSRIHNPLSVQAGGSGIGLYLAGEIVRLHQGAIAVDSKIGKGTTFAISLPLMQNENQNQAEVFRHGTGGKHPPDSRKYANWLTDEPIKPRTISES